MSSTYQATDTTPGFNDAEVLDVNLIVHDLNEFFQAAPETYLHVFIVQPNGDEEQTQLPKSALTLVAIAAL